MKEQQASSTEIARGRATASISRLGNPDERYRLVMEAVAEGIYEC